MTAILGIMPQAPDIVVAGINHGPNLGTDITYSGTAAVARQAAYMGVPGVAVSIDGFDGPWHFDPVATFVAAHLHDFVDLFDGHHFVNVNAPNLPNLTVPVEITHPCRRMYNDRMIRFHAPRGEDYWFLKGSPIDTSDETGSDWNAISRGSISLSPIHLHPMNYLVHEQYRQRRFVTQAQGRE
jgi:5'-nucleotidase